MNIITLLNQYLLNKYFLTFALQIMILLFLKYRKDGCWRTAKASDIHLSVALRMEIIVGNVVERPKDARLMS